MTPISGWLSAIELRRCLNALACVLALAGSPLVAQAPDRVLPNLKPQPRQGPRLDTLWVVGGAEARGGVELGAVAGAAIDSSGRILLADFINQHLVVLDQSGKHLRNHGRKGSGPDEFRLPTRVVSARDGRIFVLDAYDGRLSEFGSDLSFIRTMLLQPMLSDRYVLITDSLLVIAGTERTGARTHAVVHQFRLSDGARIRSFGQLLPARTPLAAYEVGAGPIALTPAGETWYVTPGPYRVELYSRTGEKLLSAERPNDFLPPAEDGVVITEAGGRTSFSFKEQPRMGWVMRRGSGILEVVVRLGENRYVIDEFTVTGSGAATNLTLTRSSLQSGPILDPARMIRPGVYLEVDRDEDRVSRATLVRVRAGVR